MDTFIVLWFAALVWMLLAEGSAILLVGVGWASLLKVGGTEILVWMSLTGLLDVISACVILGMLLTPSIAELIVATVILAKVLFKSWTKVLIWVLITRLLQEVGTSILLWMLLAPILTSFFVGVITAVLVLEIRIPHLCTEVLVECSRCRCHC